MTEAYTTFATQLKDAVDAYIAAKLLELAEKRLVLQKVAEQYPLESHMSKTLRVIDVPRLNLPNQQLAEGITPPSNALGLAFVEVTVEQWGLYVTLTDVLQLTVKHPMLNIAIDRVSLAMKEVMEREDAQVLMTAPNVTYAGDATSRVSLDSADVFNTALAITVKTKLSMRGAPAYDPDGFYIGFIQPPHTAAVLSSDQTFQQASSFARLNNLQYGYLGTWMGIDWVEGNFLPVFVGVAAADTNAITATKAMYTVGTAGTLATANYQLKIVARDTATDYERRISVQTGNIAVTSPGSIAVQVPSSSSYSYDIYLTQAGGTTAYLVRSRVPASDVFTITTAPTGNEAVAPAHPTSGVNVYPGFVCGRGGFGTCTLNGMALQTFTTPGGASDSDPLSQRRKVGAKFMRKSFLPRPEFIERFETSSTFAAAIPA